MDNWTIVYLSALIVGGSVVLLAVFSGDGDADPGDPELGEGFQLLSILRLRLFFYFACFFGFAGLLGSLLLDQLSNLIAAAAIGGTCAWIADRLLATLSAKTYSSNLEEGELAGLIGTVTVPIAPGSKGKILGTLKGRTVEMLAQLPKAEDHLDAGAKVMIIEVEQGVALVEPE